MQFTSSTHLGIGLGEDTALIIKNNIAECRVQAW